MKKQTFSLKDGVAQFCIVFTAKHPIGVTAKLGENGHTLAAVQLSLCCGSRLKLAHPIWTLLLKLTCEQAVEEGDQGSAT